MVKYYFHKLKLAICSFSSPNDKGYVLLTEYPSYIKLHFQLKNLLPGCQEFSIHEFGDGRNGLENMGRDYFGDPTYIIINNEGICNDVVNFFHLRLDQIIGRSIVINNSELKYAYGIIGHCASNKKIDQNKI